LVDQLATALRGRKSLGQQGDWVVMAAWLLLLRSQLLLPANEPAQAAATAEADRLRARLGALRDMQALADWLERQPQLGRDVFARGQPELLGTAFEPAHQVDGIEFLWASLALFDDDPAPDTESLYRPLSSKFYDVAAARARILRVLATVPDGAPLERFLPAPPDSTETEPRRALRRRAAWASTLIGGLELAKQGDVVLAPAGGFSDHPGQRRRRPGAVERGVAHRPNQLGGVLPGWGLQREAGARDGACSCFVLALLSCPHDAWFWRMQSGWAI
jgi:segregation and condensation protein A